MDIGTTVKLVFHGNDSHGCNMPNKRINFKKKIFGISPIIIRQKNCDFSGSYTKGVIGRNNKSVGLLPHAQENNA